MARQYSPKDFLRNVSNSILKEYFTRYEAFNEVDFDPKKEIDIGEVFEAMGELTDSQRSTVNGNFHDINAMATEGGVKTLIEVSQFTNNDYEDLAPILGEIEGLHDQVFRAFLDYSELFDEAIRLYDADCLPGRNWRKRDQLPDKKAITDKKTCELLEKAVSAYYRTKEGRGYACKVEPYSRDGRDYWFVYSQNYASVLIEFENKEFKRGVHHLAFEIIFVYSAAERSLDLFVKGDSKTVGDLQNLWARVILGVDDLGKPEKKAAVYQLNQLKTPQDFTFESTDGIEEVRVKKLRLSIIGDKANKRMTLEANAGNNSNAVYELYDAVLASEKIPNALINVTQVCLQIVFRANTKSGLKSIDVNIGYPNSCSLKYEPKDEIIRKYLRKWKIDISKGA
ncbi:MAG: hypothetical protein FVQ82_13985 [Planctomycetes bacterium]|nr:hypothetical protein [Planctomycetota bacterium]